MLPLTPGARGEKQPVETPFSHGVDGLPHRLPVLTPAEIWGTGEGTYAYSGRMVSSKEDAVDLVLQAAPVGGTARPDFYGLRRVLRGELLWLYHLSECNRKLSGKDL